MVNASSGTIEVRIHLGGFARLTRNVDVISALSRNIKHARFRPFARWRRFISATRIHFVFRSYLNLSIPARIKPAKILIYIGKQNTEEFWY